MTLSTPPFLEYTHPDDDLAAAVTPTLATGTAATGYPPAHVGNQDPAYPFKTDTDTFRLVWDFGSPATIEAVVLIHQNFDDGLADVKFQMHASSSWTSPSFSRTLTIPAYHEDRFPVNVWTDLRDALPSYRYASLAVLTANSVPCAIGEIILAQTIRALDGTFQLDAEEDESHPLIENRTDVGVSTIYAHGTRWRWIRGDVTHEGAVAEQLRAWNRATLGRGLPCVIWPHLDAADEPLFVRFEQDKLPRTHLAPDGISKYRIGFEEVSRGLRPTPAAV
jgi:hypothetical protein